ncbi:hypothetical protein [Paraburkholderia sp. BR10882]|uniref:hypothetical protein n=1 Tax=unclassified Paraburkholderia TaxID=2615204 RepID=UPI0034CD719E
MIEFHGMSVRYAATAMQFFRAAVAVDVQRYAALVRHFGQCRSPGILSEARCMDRTPGDTR